MGTGNPQGLKPAESGRIGLTVVAGGRKGCAMGSRWRCPVLMLALVSWLSAPAAAETAAGLQTVEGCLLVPGEWADGDSFKVRFPDGEEHVVRLYFADCPEATAGAPGDAERIREQSRYFGVKNPLQTMEFGRAATSFVAEQLERPFSVSTAFAGAMGRTKKPRIYGFVTTADGEDLAALLVGNGLARARGVQRMAPDGTPHDEVAAMLSDLEDQAKMARLGVWGATDLKELVEGRKVNREMERADEELKRRMPPEPMNVNEAGLEMLKLLPGIGEKLASEIIGRRPYKTLEDLDAVPGIGPKTLEAIKPFLRFSD